MGPRKPIGRESVILDAAFEGPGHRTLSGDPEKGAYQAFTKFAPGVNNALHTHANDVTIVVLKGAYLYKPEMGEEEIQRRSQALRRLDYPTAVRVVDLDADRPLERMLLEAKREVWEEL